MSRLWDKLLAFFSLIRVQNVLALLLAQWFTATQVFCPQCHWFDLLWHRRFGLMLLATASVITAGYIIDGFYNLRRDFINRPAKTVREAKLDMAKKLYLYFALNIFALMAAWLISWRAALFFGTYAFVIWLYFHKAQRRPWLHEAGPPALIMVPFFGLMLFFKSWNNFIVWAGILVFLGLMIKEYIKENLTLPGDLTQNIHSILVKYGLGTLRKALWITLLAWYAVWIRMFTLVQGEYLRFFLVIMALWMPFIVYLFLKQKFRWAYLHIRLFIAAGILSLWLI